MNGYLALPVRKPLAWTDASPYALPLAVGAGVYAALILAGTQLLNDADTFWHIAAGNWIVAHGAVPATDPFSHSMAGAPWVAHEWLAEVLLAALHGMAGWTGVVMAGAFAGAAAFAVLTFELQKQLSMKLVLPAIAVSFLLAASHLSARPHLFALPLLTIWTVGLVTARSKEKAPSPALLPVMILWANMHGGFVIGLGLAAALAGEAVLAAAPGERWPRTRAWGIFLAGAAGASLLTPHGISGWFFPFELMSQHYSLSLVAEWAAPDFARFQPLELFLAGAGAAILLYRPPLAAIRWILLAGLAAMAMRHNRNAELLAFTGPLLLAGPLGRAGAKSMGGGMDLSRIPIAAIAGGALALASLAAICRGYTPSNPATLPEAAFAAAAEAGAGGAVFNDYDFGGYLIFKGMPVFVDGRIDLYKDEFLRAQENAIAGHGLFELLEKYRIGWTMLRPKDAAVTLLDAAEEWQRVYTGTDAAVHRRVTRTAPEPRRPHPE